MPVQVQFLCKQVVIFSLSQRVNLLSLIHKKDMLDKYFLKVRGQKFCGFQLICQ